MVDNGLTASHNWSSLVYLGFYAVSTVFQLFNDDSSQIHVPWTFSSLTQYLIS